MADEVRFSIAKTILNSNK